MIEPGYGQPPSENKLVISRRYQSCSSRRYLSVIRRSSAHASPVCTENSNPSIVVMESAENGDRFGASGPLNRTSYRRIPVEEPSTASKTAIAYRFAGRNVSKAIGYK